MNTVRGVLFDVDGTLYHQGRLRALMLAELAAAPIQLRSVSRARALVRVLGMYRTIHEEMRQPVAEHGPLDSFQVSETARRLCVSEDAVRHVVAEWMWRRPLKYLQVCRRRGLVPLFAELARRRIRIGVLSDYPSQEKLEALGIATFVSPVLCTLDPDINALKPDPRGFWRACELWSLPPEEVLYVGDRPDVDASGALAAGIRCVLVGRARSGSRAPRRNDRYDVVPRLQDLAAVVAR